MRGKVWLVPVCKAGEAGLYVTGKEYGMFRIKIPSDEPTEEAYQKIALGLEALMEAVDMTPAQFMDRVRVMEMEVAQGRRRPDVAKAREFLRALKAGDGGYVELLFKHTTAKQ